MSERNEDASILGKRITHSFTYVQQIYQETSSLLQKLDELMRREKWEPLYGNRITRDVSASLVWPNYWLASAVFRIYQNQAEKLIRKGVSIRFCENDLDRPALIAGKITYKDIDQNRYDNPWDLELVWFSENNESNKLDGRERSFTEIKESNLTEYVSTATLFAYPLTEIQTEEDIKSKISDNLIKL